MGFYANAKISKNCMQCEWRDAEACNQCELMIDNPFPSLTEQYRHCPFQMIAKRHALVPVPPHGDLIDRDVARGTIKPWSPDDEWSGCTFDTVKKLMHTLLSRAPTIIEAEEGKA